MLTWSLLVLCLLQTSDVCSKESTTSQVESSPITPQENDLWQPHNGTEKGLLGSRCQHDLDCNRELLCINASFKCGCPSETHFILSGGDGETALCVRGRKLSEPCVSHLECSLGDPNARCLNSFCSCAAHFYVPTATVTCTSVRWYSTSAVLLPILVLVPVVFVIGMIAYKRLHTDLGWKMLLLGVGKQRHKRFHNEKDTGDAAPATATIPLDRYITARSCGCRIGDLNVGFSGCLRSPSVSEPQLGSSNSCSELSSELQNGACFLLPTRAIAIKAEPRWNFGTLDLKEVVEPNHAVSVAYMDDSVGTDLPPCRPFFSVTGRGHWAVNTSSVAERQPIITSRSNPEAMPYTTYRHTKSKDVLATSDGPTKLPSRRRKRLRVNEESFEGFRLTDPSANDSWKGFDQPRLPKLCSNSAFEQARIVRPNISSDDCTANLQLCNLNAIINAESLTTRPLARSNFNEPCRFSSEKQHVSNSELSGDLWLDSEPFLPFSTHRTTLTPPSIPKIKPLARATTEMHGPRPVGIHKYHSEQSRSIVPFNVKRAASETRGRLETSIKAPQLESSGSDDTATLQPSKSTCFELARSFGWPTLQSDQLFSKEFSKESVADEPEYGRLYSPFTSHGSTANSSRGDADAATYYRLKFPCLEQTLFSADDNEQTRVLNLQQELNLATRQLPEHLPFASVRGKRSNLQNCRSWGLQRPAAAPYLQRSAQSKRFSCSVSTSSGIVRKLVQEWGTGFCATRSPGQAQASPRTSSPSSISCHMPSGQFGRDDCARRIPLFRQRRARSRVRALGQSPLSAPEAAAHELFCKSSPGPRSFSGSGVGGSTLFEGNTEEESALSLSAERLESDLGPSSRTADAGLLPYRSFSSSFSSGSVVPLGMVCCRDAALCFMGGSSMDS